MVYHLIALHNTCIYITQHIFPAYVRLPYLQMAIAAIVMLFIYVWLFIMLLVCDWLSNFPAIWLAAYDFAFIGCSRIGLIASDCKEFFSLLGLFSIFILLGKNICQHECNILMFFGMFSGFWRSTMNWNGRLLSWRTRREGNSK